MWVGRTCPNFLARKALVDPGPDVGRAVTTHNTNARVGATPRHPHLTVP